MSSTIYRSQIFTYSSMALYRYSCRTFNYQYTLDRAVQRWVLRRVCQRTRRTRLLSRKNWPKETLDSCISVYLNQLLTGDSRTLARPTLSRSCSKSWQRQHEESFWQSGLIHRGLGAQPPTNGLPRHCSSSTKQTTGNAGLPGPLPAWTRVSCQISRNVYYYSF